MPQTPDNTAVEHTTDRPKASSSIDLYTTAMERSWFGVRGESSGTSPAQPAILVQQQAKGPRGSWCNLLESHLS